MIPRLIVLLCVLAVSVTPLTAHADDAITRRDGFLLLWQGVKRVAEETREKPYTDVPKGSVGFLEITYAKARGLLRDDERFYPDEPLYYSDALLMLFRTRNVEPFGEGDNRRLMETAEAEDVPRLAAHYGLPEKEGSISREELAKLMQDFDTTLVAEEHETSFYSEKFHGDGTAFGETFDMHAMTAAHRTLPHNTLVRVTNIANEKSVVVRINDRGPFVQGRNMDLSLAAFLALEERSKGKIQARYERLGDASLVSACGPSVVVRRIHRRTALREGIPNIFELGRTLSLSSADSFVVRDIVYPDGIGIGVQTWVTGDETFTFTPSIAGTYMLVIGSKDGKNRSFTLEAKECGNSV